MKMEYLESVIAAAVGGLITIGSMAIFGDGVGLGIALGVMGALMWFGKRTSDEDNKKYADAQKRLCEERMLRYDALIDRGEKVVYNDKPWRKGCRIDAATGAMIEPAM
jgi:hypothetical protein